MLIVEKSGGRDRHIIDTQDAEVVLSIRAWAAVSSLGYSTAKKILAAGEGPRVTRLSAGRIGVRMSEHQRWLAERTET
jgi:hypothetical protein